MKEVKNTYFKEGGGLMSGLPLPKDSDGIVRDKKFIDCDFHPNYSLVRFENCEFVGGGLYTK